VTLIQPPTVNYGQPHQVHGVLDMPQGANSSS
jgi:hypothetical protein